MTSHKDTVSWVSKSYQRLVYERDHHWHTTHNWPSQIESKTSITTTHGRHITTNTERAAMVAARRGGYTTIGTRIHLSTAQREALASYLLKYDTADVESIICPRLYAKECAAGKHRDITHQIAWSQTADRTNNIMQQVQDEAVSMPIDLIPTDFLVILHVSTDLPACYCDQQVPLFTSVEVLVPSGIVSVCKTLALCKLMDTGHCFALVCGVEEHLTLYETCFTGSRTDHLPMCSTILVRGGSTFIRNTKLTDGCMADLVWHPWILNIIEPQSVQSNLVSDTVPVSLQDLYLTVIKALIDLDIEKDEALLILRRVYKVVEEEEEEEETVDIVDLSQKLHHAHGLGRYTTYREQWMRLTLSCVTLFRCPNTTWTFPVELHAWDLPIAKDVDADILVVGDDLWSSIAVPSVPQESMFDIREL